jgi:hypothetical protein
VVFRRVPLVHLAEHGEASALEPQARFDAPRARHRRDELFADAVRVENAPPLDAERRSFEKTAERHRVRCGEVEGIVDEEEAA